MTEESQTTHSRLSILTESLTLLLDCSQPSILSYFYSIVERADIIARIVII